MDAAIHSPILVKSQSGLVNTRELRELHRLVCEEHKRSCQFVFRVIIRII